MKTIKLIAVLVALSLLSGCTFLAGLVGMAGSGTPTADDAAAVQAGIKAFVGLLTGDYYGALYWGSAACGGSLYAGGKATKAGGQATAAVVKRVVAKRKAKKDERTAPPPAVD